MLAGLLRYCFGCALFVLPACGHQEAPAPASSAPATPTSALPEVLPSRPEVVVHADKLAVQGAQKGGAEGARLSLTAAELRQRLWRLEGREVDALEALELYRAAEQVEWDDACQAAVDRLLLEAELRADPADAYRALYLVRAEHPDQPCARRAESVLDTLHAFRPLPSVLAELDREALARRDAEAPDAAKVQKAAVRIDEQGPVVVPTLSGTQPKGPVRITGIERYGAKDAARIVVMVTRPATFDVGFIPARPDKGPRLYVDIKEASYRGKRDLGVGGIVERVRVGKRKDGTRVVLDLEAPVYRKVFYLPEPFRLIIDVSKEAPQTPGNVAGGARMVRRVVLDPGHGGHDPGAIGPGGLREKDVTLDIAHRAAPLIARELKIATMLTRDSDDFVPLDERTARANAFGADLFVSIHCNASENGHGQGVMTFVLDQSTGDDIASRVAARENSASPAAAVELANIMSRVLDEGSIARSAHFAGLLQRATLASLEPSYPGIRDHGVKRAGFYVLAGAHMPAVLYETSFISNDKGEARLNTGDYRQKLADSIVNAVHAYREGR